MTEEEKLVEVMAVAIATRMANEYGYERPHEVEIICSRAYARAALAAIREGVWRPVPMEPTEEMRAEWGMIAKETTRRNLQDILDELTDKWLDGDSDITDLIDILEDKADELREIELHLAEAKVRFYKNKIDNQNKI